MKKGDATLLYGIPFLEIYLFCSKLNSCFYESLE